MKKCVRCGEDKTHYYTGCATCADCVKLRMKEHRNANPEKYRRYDRERQQCNYSRMWGHRYTAMKQRVDGTATHTSSAEGKGICSRTEFLAWCEETKHIFNKLVDNWVASGYKRSLSPSIDRINNNEGYVLGNMQWLTNAENHKKDPVKYDPEVKKRDRLGRFIT